MLAGTTCRGSSFGLSIGLLIKGFCLMGVEGLFDHCDV